MEGIIAITVVIVWAKYLFLRTKDNIYVCRARTLSLDFECRLHVSYFLLSNGRCLIFPVEIGGVVTGTVVLYGPSTNFVRTEDNVMYVEDMCAEVMAVKYGG